MVDSGRLNQDFESPDVGRRMERILVPANEQLLDRLSQRCCANMVAANKALRPTSLLRGFAPTARPSFSLVVTPHKVERPARDEEVHENTHASSSPTTAG